MEARLRSSSWKPRKLGQSYCLLQTTRKTNFSLDPGKLVTYWNQNPIILRRKEISESLQHIGLNVSPPNSYVRPHPLTVAVFGDSVSEEVIKVK